MKLRLFILVGSAVFALPAFASPLDSEFASQAREYEQLFAQGKAAELSRLWTDDGTLELSDGRKYRGRGAIENYFRQGFALTGLNPLKIEIKSLKTVVPDSVVIEEGVATHGASAKPSATYTAMHLKSADGWKIVWAEEELVTSSHTLDELDWLCGVWKSGSEATNSLEMKVEKIENGKFLQVTSTVGKTASRGIIGLDPLTGRLISWHFDSQGGHGQGQWDSSHGRWRLLA
ncbi:MAG: nuclear transport factor 2 family protein, partial [Cyanobacteria bacterium]|nr:nuclear transport factor 2 family protein [Cyanobacteriota bacterium]